MIFSLVTPKKEAAVWCLREAGLETLNIPDRPQWDFAGEWDTMLAGYPRYQRIRTHSLWNASADPLGRSIAVPVGAVMNAAILPYRVTLCVSAWTGFEYQLRDQSLAGQGSPSFWVKSFNSSWMPLSSFKSAIR
jgi:hypothetical protein